MSYFICRCDHLRATSNHFISSPGWDLGLDVRNPTLIVKTKRLFLNDPTYLHHMQFHIIEIAHDIIYRFNIYHCNPTIAYHNELALVFGSPSKFKSSNRVSSR